MKNAIRIIIAVAVLVGIVLAIRSGIRRYHRRRAAALTVIGAVIKQDSDARKQSPIADVEISAPAGSGIATTKSDFSGYFKVLLPASLDSGEPVALHFKHPDYQPVDLKAVAGDRLYVVPMIPTHGEVESELTQPQTVVSNVLVRYTNETSTTQNIGVGVKTFTVTNTGNVPCFQHVPCSPDGKWKATIESATMDAGDGNVFQNARVTCIAGPCPFTKIESDDFSKAARVIKVTIRNWSDTTTFLLQAEVFHRQVGDIVRKSYPVIFGRSMNFTLPADAEGVTIEAELGGSQIIFPLAPVPNLSWADCKVNTEGNQTARDYRCELKAKYRFR